MDAFVKKIPQNTNVYLQSNSPKLQQGNITKEYEVLLQNDIVILSNSRVHATYKINV